MNASRVIGNAKLGRMRAPTGDQYELTRENDGVVQHAVITQVGAALRGFTVGGIDIAEPYPQTSTPPSGAGIVLVPWPNRVKDGAWILNGEEQLLALTEPARDNAIHGLLRYSEYRPVEIGRDALTLAATVYPQLGYPFLLDTTVRYDLGDDGLHVTHTISNVGDGTAPVAVGTHPYLRIGDVPTGDLKLTVNAASHVDVDDRLNVIGRSPVAGGPYDIRDKRVAELELDDGWADVEFVGGRSIHTLTAPDGRVVELWGDSNFGYVQVYTSRDFKTDTVSDVAIAIEPMTAPANALNSGESLHWLEPGKTWTAQWGIAPRGF
jgi:aldose 1-epimerase